MEPETTYPEVHQECCATSQCKADAPLSLEHELEAVLCDGDDSKCMQAQAEMGLPEKDLLLF